MADTKLNDEVAITSVDDDTQIYAEQDIGGWFPFKVTFLNIWTWIVTKFKTDLTGNESNAAPTVSAVKSAIDTEIAARNTAIELATENPSTVRAFVADVNLISEGQTELVPAKAGYRFVPVAYHDLPNDHVNIQGGYIVTTLDGTIVSDAQCSIGIVGDEDRYGTVNNFADINNFKPLNGFDGSDIPSGELINPINVKVTTAAILLTATEYRCQVVIYGFYLQLV